MILRVDPRLPLVWRSPSSVQLGIDPPAVVLAEVTPTQEKLLSALVAGISRSGLGMMAQEHPDDCNDLLDALSRVLVATPPQPPSAHVAIVGSGRLAEAIAHSLSASGVSVSVADEADGLTGPEPDLAIMVGHYVIAPSVHRHWLHRDIPHLPVVLSDTAAEVGPVVTPGISACLLCIELHRRDGDAAWPAIAAQLMGRTAQSGSPVLLAEAAAEATRMALHRLGRIGYTVFDRTPADATTSVRIDSATGRRDDSLRFRHPECGCAEIVAAASAQSAPVGRPKSGWGHDAHPDLIAH